MRLSLFLSLLLLSSACGNGPLTAANFPAAYAKAYSEPVSRCRHQAAFLAQADLAGTQGTYDTDLPKALKLGRAAFDATQAQLCLDALTGRDCDRVNETPTACFNSVRGLVPDGGACSWLFECAHGFCGGDNGCPSKCPGALTLGAECPGKGNVQCDQRLGIDCIASVCSAPLAVGGTCDESSRCAMGLFCDSFDSKCATKKNEQVVCAVDEECVHGLYCQLSGDAGLCRKKVAQGKPCGDDANHARSAASECADGLLCAGFSLKPPHPGVCSAPGDVGAACTASADVSGCAEGLNCKGGLCALPPNPGQSCFSCVCADGAYCDADPAAASCDPAAKCKAVLADGQTCTRSDQCAGRNCDSNTGTCLTPAGIHACHEP